MNKILLYKEIYLNMGVRYFYFRTIYEIKRRTGLLKKKFPSTFEIKSFIPLEEWKKLNINFFFDSRETVNIPKKQIKTLKEEAEKIFSGEIQYFSYQWFKLGQKYDWVTNPENNYKYDIKKHWTEIPDFSAEAGDIKYVWEKSRFSYLYSVIRYDYHFDIDCSSFVFAEIIDWIDKNPLNMGPNYRCSQEISLRILNWTFVLFYYKNSLSLNEEIFNKILNSIYCQIIHVRDNIDFSRIAVRNNHAITETLTLYLVGLLYSFFDVSEEIKKSGKEWFEDEIMCQIYNDGTYLQYSTNYNRVVVQLLTWAFYISEYNGEKYSDSVYEKGYKTLNFLFGCQDSYSNLLPNYGANDGALFFKLNNNAYRNYAPQLNSLYYYFFGEDLYENDEIREDSFWYGRGIRKNKFHYEDIKRSEKVSEFKEGGIYLFKEKKTLTFIKCADYKNRPSHADNLHVDIWYDGINILRDGGTYKYNTSPELQKYFSGCASHNTIMLGDHDHMLKGPRFIWLKWPKLINTEIEENEFTYTFTGEINAFRHLAPEIIIIRKVVKIKNEPSWLISDSINGNSLYTVRQIWNPDEYFFDKFRIEAKDENEIMIKPKYSDGYFSSYYGQKQLTKQIIFETGGNRIETSIKLK